MSTPSEIPDLTPLKNKVLVIDDEWAIGKSIQRALTPKGHEVVTTQDPQEGLQLAQNNGFDLILLDLMMPGRSGLDVLRDLKATGASGEVVIITGHSTVETAVEAMQIGAADYLPKPFTPQQIYMVLEKVAKQSALMRENAALRRELEVEQGLEGIIGESPAIQKVFTLLRRVAPTEGTVLITGESGTGKEMIVRAIHRLSRRQDQPMVACDCSALAPTLLETELFGHVKGSFSGAISTKQGLFESAHGGTLFLDEIANLSLEIQGKLLRVLETKQVRKVGDTEERDVDIRLVAATNRELTELVKSGDFREDLYYRLNVVPVYLPPLREREGDIPRLAMVFLDRFCRKNSVEVEAFTPEAMSLMEAYRWPGNVRELRNIVERIAILCDSSRIEPRHLPIEIQSVRPQKTPTELPRDWEDFKHLKQEVRDATVRQLEERFLKEALARHEGSVSQAAREIGMQRTHFHALMRKYGISVN